MKHPLALNNKQKTLASLLAIGVPTEEAARQLGVSKAYVEVLLKGGLFQFEVDRAREKLIGERLGEYNKLVSTQLIPNLEVLIALRDDPKTPATARLRAIELINESVVPKAKPFQAGTEAKIKIELSAEKAAEAAAVAAEAFPINAEQD